MTEGTGDPAPGTPGSVLILGISADIGRELALRYLQDGASVIGTYRNSAHLGELAAHPRATLLPCDLAEPASIAAAAGRIAALRPAWDLLVGIAGTMEPIGPFLDLDMDAWERNLRINCFGQLRFLQAVYPQRRPDATAHVMFSAGGGTNNPFTNYSAYCLSKILLIKMCELLDDEVPDINAFIIGPGFVQTKIHRETLAAGARAGEGLGKTEAFLQTEGTSFDDIHAHIAWCMAAGRALAGGRNFSTVHDPWRDGSAALREALAADPNLFKLRRMAAAPPAAAKG
ncbi:MAG: SDR family oxidoreductase [Sneathiellaceae bacterium]